MLESDCANKAAAIAALATNAVITKRFGRIALLKSLCWRMGTRDPQQANHDVKGIPVDARPRHIA
jgi:hypothetical protein